MPPSLRSRLLLLFALTALATACRAQRELVIVSDPPGAQIRLDGMLWPEKTPAHIPFKDYGVRRITLYLDGHMTYSEAFDVRAPWYAFFPIDILSEIVFPVGWHDRHKLRVKLVRGDTRTAAPDLVKVLQRAEILRRAGPEGLKLETKEAQPLPRETSGQGESVPQVPPPKPPDPAGAGGGR